MGYHSMPTSFPYHFGHVLGISNLGPQIHSHSSLSERICAFIWSHKLCNFGVTCMSGFAAALTEGIKRPIPAGAKAKQPVTMARMAEIIYLRCTEGSSLRLNGALAQWLFQTLKTPSLQRGSLECLKQP